MPSPTEQNTIKTNLILGWFLAGWTLLNIIQAFTLEIHADEAYYWMYSKFLDWGYFDHPPMVAVFIKIGDSLVHNEFGLRLVTIITSSLSIYVLWLILKKYSVDVWQFVLITAGIFIFSIYGFTTTPDAPLYFFAILFYYVYQKYIDDDSWLLALLLGVLIACMLYSKYHAVLLVFFTVASNINLFRRPSFYLIAALAVALYLPHILWQVQHGYPSLNYHLYERAASIYNSSNSYSYLPGQLLMAGPLIGWFLFYRAFTIKIKDAFIRCLLVNCVGTLIFFFITTFRGEAQPHWTLIAFAPLAMLALIGFKQVGGVSRWFYLLAVVNIVLIVTVRLCLVFGVPFVKQLGQIKSYFGFKDWANVVKQKAGNAYVVMADGFQNPSKYNYYTNSLKGFSYDSRFYHRTQFDIWPIEEKMQRQRVLYLNDYKNRLTTDSIKTAHWTWYIQWIDDFRTYQKVKIETKVNAINVKQGDSVKVDLMITNPYKTAINFSNVDRMQHVLLGAAFFKGDKLVRAQKSDDAFNQITLQPGESKLYTFNLIPPKQKGTYQLIFSVKTTPFAGSTNSRTIKLTVE
ncbi:glycosyltransferase family 39 protein [Mucilaginibacter auburnensis]|uniref:Dolichyl-phosphate-mannose-protein mannosyltransferase n=1 Tax=Mucilaginibacter auburnensis TaxID=1457233 RepID=A0A2H9VN27_9SPHI|nr:glycosyltransferase family 39 protein [Mucilaginibacter auburnensis]PJJ79747.1 dolichyl-phosphate-mannose-protein mannosyltransferase [Mucilaginibacter auburnensis]